MNATLNQNADLQALAEQIKALGCEVEHDALVAAKTNDLAGLVYIANMARGLPGGATMRMGLAMDLADYLTGVMPKTTRGIDRS